MVFVAAAAVAALGMLAHNLLSLPLALGAPENLGPVLVWCGLLAWHLATRGAGATRAALLVWTALNLMVGGFVTILPLPVLPFVPEQTVSHYLAHVIYTITQVPMLWVLLRRQRAVAVA